MTTDSKTLTVTWGPAEHGQTRHAFPVREPSLWQRTFKPRSLCGVAWSNDRDPLDKPELRTCRRCQQLLAMHREREQ